MLTLHPDASPGLQLWRVTLSWQRQITAALKPLGLTHVQFVLLASAWWLTRQAAETPSQRRIAEHAAVDPMMTSQVMRVLSTKGLVTREADPGDGRALRIAVTAAGAQLAARAVRTVEAVDRDFFAAAPDHDALMAALRALGPPTDH